MAWASPVIDRTATMTQRAASGDDYNYFLAKNGIALACGDGRSSSYTTSIIPKVFTMRAT